MRILLYAVFISLNSRVCKLESSLFIEPYSHRWSFYIQIRNMRGLPDLVGFVLEFALIEFELKSNRIF
jgi:hypothetical protein